MATTVERTDTAVTRHRIAGSVLRVGLGATILGAGAHKLFVPAAWHAYLAGPLVALWPGILPLDPAFVLFGIIEVTFGLLLLVDWHTPTVALLTALSLVGVVLALAVGIAVGEAYADVLIRNRTGALAAGVALDAGSSEAHRPAGSG